MRCFVSARVGDLPTARGSQRHAGRRRFHFHSGYHACALLHHDVDLRAVTIAKSKRQCCWVAAVHEARGQFRPESFGCARAKAVAEEVVQETARRPPLIYRVLDRGEEFSDTLYFVQHRSVRQPGDKAGGILLYSRFPADR